MFASLFWHTRALPAQHVSAVICPAHMSGCRNAKKRLNVATFYSRLLVGETRLKIAAALTVMVEADLSSVREERGNLYSAVQSTYKGFSFYLC